MMRYFFYLFFIWSFSLFSLSIECDVAVIGTSPFSLLEALYQHHTGNRVVIIEQANTCGGAWRSINICGVEHVDLGCHQIGHDAQLLHFLEEYVGCTMVSLDNPQIPYTRSNRNGYYPSRGCYEIIDHLLKLIEKTDIRLFLNHRMESVAVDPLRTIGIIQTKDEQILAKKIILPLYTDLRYENHPTMPLSAQQNAPSKYPHLYLLIKDPGTARFSYHASIGPGISRMMNLTDFTGLTGSGTQLIALQCHGTANHENGEKYLKLLKEKQLVDPDARLLKVDSYTYEQYHYNSQLIEKNPQAGVIFESLNTGHIQNLSQYIPRWKMGLQPYQQAME